MENNEDPNAGGPDTEENAIESCFCWAPEAQLGPGENLAALQRRYKWPPQSAISVSFLDGNPSVQARVKAVALEWVKPGRANLRFDFRTDTTDTLIRISFQYAGSWSTVGTSCKQVPKGQPTMNFGWLTKRSTDAEVRSVVLHEFGHALGLIHEHQHPVNGIKWNKDVVYHELSGPPNNWSREQIDFNMFQGFSKQETNFGKFDPKSIMMYAFPRR